MHALLAELDDKLPKVGWFRNCLITLGVGTSVLFCCRFYLAFRRAKCNNKVLLSGKTCIITGANTGIGKAVALEFARRKAKVILACRDVQKGNDAAIDIRRSIKDANVNVYQLDLASFTSIRNFVQLYKENENTLDILVNNAGLMYAPFTKSEDGIELHFAVNHLGHFLLTNLLLDYMNNHSRIIVVSSALYKKAQLDLINFNEEEIYDAFQAYGKSKLANILFVNELQHYLPPRDPLNNVYNSKYFNLSLDEKRTFYKCGNKFKTLDDIPLWDAYQKIYCKANPSLMGGGGVDGCIHQAAGSTLKKECLSLNGCCSGEAKITAGHCLPAKYIIHTVGPVGKNPDLLESCYKNCLQLVLDFEIKTIAFCCISTGIYGYPNKDAAHVALKYVRHWLEENYNKIDRIIFCTYISKDFEIYKELMSNLYFS
ncbi:retinol dehydrogenase 14 isoform X6 [Hydra vulgaris]|uniref:Retinol dehydrogenase 14 isoform X6 n=1 Tax=Hydra vulgaris TaxID=6087 RepID=A0ABM4CKC7_HYDVU